MKLRKKRILLNIFGVLLSAIVLVPVYFVVINSLKGEVDANQLKISWPESFHFVENYAEVIREGGFFSALRNSVLVTGLSVFLTMIVSSMAAFIFQRRQSKVSGAIDFLILMGLIVPPAIVPTYFILKMVNMQSSYTGVVLLYIAIYIPLSVVLYKGFFKTIPREIDEAAIMDGCNFFQLFARIIFPLLKPVNSTVLILLFMSIWNDFNIPLYFLNTPKRYTLPLTIYFFCGQYKNSWNLVFADVIMIALPVTILYVFCQKHVISGMTSGAIKS